MDLFNSPHWKDHIDNIMRQWHVPGLAIAVAHNDTTASQGFGHATLDPPKPCTADTLFDIGSASKSLTTGAVGILVNDDENYSQLQWDSKMSDLLPDDFIMSEDSYTQDVTVEDILSHRTGLAPHDYSYLGINASRPDTAKSVTRNLRNLEIAAPIRTKYIYCNLMLTVATHLIETLSGLSFSEFLHEHIFTPLDMDSTNLQPDAARAAGLGYRMATGYSWLEDEKKHIEVPYVQSPEAQGAGSIVTSVNDYIKWVRAVMNQQAPLNKNIVEEVTKPRILENPIEFGEGLDPFTSWTAYAAGWESFYYRGIRIVKHDGLIDGFGTQHFFVPDVKFGGVIFGNSGDSSNDLSWIVMYELIDEALNVPKEQRVDWNARYQLLARKRDEAPDDLRAALCRDDTGPQHQAIPLAAYTGTYWNSGYRHLIVEGKDDVLFIDATDRSNKFYIKFEHFRDQRIYIAHLINALDPADLEQRKAEFRFENDKVVRVGIELEPELHGLIWFEKCHERKGPQ